MQRQQPKGPVSEFRWRGHTLRYEERGEGARPFVLMHGLLLPSWINGQIADRLAAAGHRMILFDLLGHGRSDKPTHATAHRLEFAGEQVVALLDHLELEEAVVGGVSLGANVTLEAAVRAPQRIRAMVCEMPVLERGTIGVQLQLAPLLFLLRYGGWPLRAFFNAVGKLPRTRSEVLNAVLDTGGDTREMAAVMHGFAAGPVCPPLADRKRLDAPTLVIGHGGDWMHPMDDAEALAAELPNARLVQARSFFELRTRPERIVGEIGRFLDEVWAPRLVAADEA